MTVYVTQEPPAGLSILAAQKYGQLKILCPPQVSMFNTKDLVDNLKSQLLMFNDKDYLLPMGDPAVIGVATAIASSVNEGLVNFLKWDRLEKQYFIWTVQIGRRR